MAARRLKCHQNAFAVAKPTSHAGLIVDPGRADCARTGTTAEKASPRQRPDFTSPLYRICVAFFRPISPVTGTLCETRPQSIATYRPSQLPPRPRGLPPCRQPRDPPRRPPGSCVLGSHTTTPSRNIGASGLRQKRAGVPPDRWPRLGGHRHQAHQDREACGWINIGFAAIGPRAIAVPAAQPVDMAARLRDCGARPPNRATG